MPAFPIASTRHIRGVAWMVTSIGCFTTSMVIVRGLHDEVPTFEIVFFRALAGVAVMLPWLGRTRGVGLRTRRFGLYALRSTLAALNLWLIFTALALMQVADVTAILFTRPIFTTLLAIVLLGEAASGRLWSALAAGFVGALVLIRPGFETVNVGALLALLAAMLTALLFNIAKLLTRTESPDAIAFYQTFLMLPITVTPAILVWVTPTWEQLFWLFAMGGLATLTHRTMNRAYVLVDLTLLQPLEFVRLPVAALLGLLAFGEWPDPWVWVGGAVIFAGSIYGTAREGKARREGP